MVTTRSQKKSDNNHNENNHNENNGDNNATWSLTDAFTQKTFADLDEEKEGLVFFGCGGEIEDWVRGILETIEKEEVAYKSDFAQPYFIETTGGRIDLVFPFAEGGGPHMHKLALFMLRFGDASWISDYVVNYYRDHDF